jgi:YqxM protein
LEIYPSRKARSRKELYKKKKRLIYILQAFILYIGLINLSFITGSTVSYFNDQENITGIVSNMEDFCNDKNYKKKYKQACKDNSGIGNGCEEVDIKEEKCSEEGYDPDNPKHGENDDHPKKGNPKNKENGPENQKESSIIEDTAEVDDSKETQVEEISDEETSSGASEKEKEPPTDAPSSEETQTDTQTATDQQTTGNSASEANSADTAETIKANFANDADQE